MFESVYSWDTPACVYPRVSYPSVPTLRCPRSDIANSCSLNHANADNSFLLSSCLAHPLHFFYLQLLGGFFAAIYRMLTAAKHEIWTLMLFHASVVCLLNKFTSLYAYSGET